MLNYQIIIKIFQIIIKIFHNLASTINNNPVNSSFNYFKMTEEDKKTNQAKRNQSYNAYQSSSYYSSPNQNQNNKKNLTQQTYFSSPLATFSGLSAKPREISTILNEDFFQNKNSIAKAFYRFNDFPIFKKQILRAINSLCVKF